MNPTLQQAIVQRLSGNVSTGGKIDVHPLGGGSINEAYRIEVTGNAVFCKTNSATKFPQLFSREKEGLHLLAQQGIKTPAVIDCFEEENQQVLLLEWIQEGERSTAFWQTFGEQLAMLHQTKGSRFGLPNNNYMGSVPQANTPHESWCAFFAKERLSPMVDRCAGKNLLNQTHLRQFEALQKKLTAIFEEEPPCLVHGDLWSGNFLCNQSSEPVLIDPAVYFGHRSVDLAMTTLFGGFRQPFYDSYHYQFPLPANYEEQWAVCNLYPLLIHLYLFGSGYRSQIERTLQTFV